LKKVDKPWVNRAETEKQGPKTGTEQIVLANWGRRDVAWFIDYVIVNIMLAHFQIERMETSLLPPSILPTIPGINLSLWSPLSTLIFFLYWTFSEWYFGRSIGQLLLNLRLVDLHGRPPSLKASAIQSVGKALLLPLDCLVGWASKSCRERRQRFFSELSHNCHLHWNFK
jgi:uncharacterized RDD family membrane protein YckC